MTKNNSLKEFVAKQIRHLRLKKGMTQEALAEKAELGFNYIYRLESKELNVKIDTIEKIIHALNVDVSTFFNVETQEREVEFTKLIEDIENLPKEKREPTIKALRDILKQIE
ncbi:TPA: helix-turn-helix transcriptional regulator [Streptococcus suis]|uniref:helix-turn-helix domain-containing protein n=4 Tax=Streptococcus suis TaxID=1307 RepID=UPI000CF4C2EA|nr:helix-turn-helix transcriptional regulator [Streptococcus suis]MBM0195215.1 helix-turn-helix transcriptional regulator [Streptococcus suis]MBM7317433.1 helix-turn-helix transcriptional regulator [Streptococcus suis]HEM5943266.1 helix-turn-helix transcriptional regulator [Streptococcus suis]HEM6055670.1 helix-turn-helix transcriptional regulator [Streptococcus suis]HEM6133263.1 helix-turn-helix transcriptional regulator [Streptococcus suis]